MPDIVISIIEARVLGSLIEKEVTTPEYYPLTINALANACSQKSNRDPIMDIDEESIMLALDRLRQKQLAYETRIAGSRVPKYGHRVKEVFDFSPEEIAAMCVLLLRGPQTLGEIRARTERFYSFKDLAEVEATITRLMESDKGSFVARLPRRMGYKECRYAHLLCGDVKEDEGRTPEPTIISVRVDEERLAALERKVEEMRVELDNLKKKLAG